MMAVAIRSGKPQARDSRLSRAAEVEADAANGRTSRVLRSQC
jgi:hypothetical protein